MVQILGKIKKYFMIHTYHYMFYKDSVARLKENIFKFNYIYNIFILIKIFAYSIRFMWFNASNINIANIFIIQNITNKQEVLD